jgi:phage terminase large subunit-like protein
MSSNLAERIRRLPAPARDRVLQVLEATRANLQAGRVAWMCDRPGCDGARHPGRPGPHARPNQRPPTDEDWDTWLLLAGRGFGKTRTGSEWAIRQARLHARGALIGPTAGDARDIIVEGESGILACAPPDFRPLYEPSKRRLTYPNGAQQAVYSADEPDRLRGPQHHYAWADELASWRHLQHTWDMMQFGLRLGDHPRVCITSTPRPLPLIKALVVDENVRVVKGTTYDNLANLARTFKRAVVDRYEGTTLGRQELHADILDDMPGALVSRKLIETHRVRTAPPLELIAVGLDPAGTGTGDEAGIVVMGRAAGHHYVLADVSAKLSARATAHRAWAVYEEHGAHALVVETNFGKGWLIEVLTTVWKELHPDGGPAPIRQVNATIGKKLRAQPMAMRYEQGRTHMVGAMPKLEDQLATWDPEEDPDSPDRVDAMVHVEAFLAGRERMSSDWAAPAG